MRFIKFFRLLRCIAILMASPLPLANASYTAHDLGSGIANDINSSGTVVGQMYTASGAYAFSYSGGVVQNLGTLPGQTDSGAHAINDSGVVVGVSSNPNGPLSGGFRYSGGVMTQITGAAAIYTYPLGINNNGTIVGETYSGRAFVYSGGAGTILGTLGGPYSSATAINSSGTVVGWADGSSTHAFRYSMGVMTDLGGLFSPGNPSYAWDINDAGTVVGYGVVNGYTRAFYYSDGVMTALPTPNVWHSSAMAINSAGLIVGSYIPSFSPTTDHAALWDGNTLVDLAPYLDELGLTGWNSRAMGINDNGEIVGDAWDTNYNHRAFLLTVPEPSSATLLLAGIGILGRTLRARPKSRRSL